MMITTTFRGVRKKGAKELYRMLYFRATFEGELGHYKYRVNPDACHFSLSVLACDLGLSNTLLWDRAGPKLRAATSEDNKVEIALVSGVIFEHGQHVDLTSTYWAEGSEHILDRISCDDTFLLVPEICRSAGRPLGLREIRRNIAIETMNVPKRFRGLHLGAFAVAGVVERLSAPGDLITIVAPPTLVPYLKAALPDLCVVRDRGLLDGVKLRILAIPIL